MTEPEGYLVVETHPEHPDLVRVFSTHQSPVSPDGSPPDAGSSKIRYVAYFYALHVAGMHAQTAMRKWMVDAEAGLYRIDPVTAVAAVEAIDLRHRRIYLDPDLAAETRLDEDVARRRRQQRRNRMIWNAVGILALVLLILFAQIPVF